MRNIKYNIGDKVVVKSKKWYDDNKDESDKGYVKLASSENGFRPCFCRPMSQFCGKIVTISKIVHDAYYIDEDNNRDFWTDDMFDGYAEEILSDMGEVSDGYHTFNELYEFRLLFNAGWFNELAKKGLCDVHKSKLHSDGNIPFGNPDYFIVVAELPTGQISNHYRMMYWDLFNIPEKKTANTFDGHTPKDVTTRIRKFLTNSYPKTYLACCEIMGIHDVITTGVNGYEKNSLENFQKLITCRDAYWKMSDCNWEETRKDKSVHYVIYCSLSGELIQAKTINNDINFLLDFPSKEMSETFFYNFKPLIENSKIYI